VVALCELGFRLQEARIQHHRLQQQPGLVVHWRNACIKLKAGKDFDTEFTKEMIDVQRKSGGKSLNVPPACCLHSHNTLSRITVQPPSFYEVRTFVCNPTNHRPFILRDTLKLTAP
jgi:hypothetical protein